MISARLFEVTPREGQSIYGADARLLNTWWSESPPLTLSWSPRVIGSALVLQVYDSEHRQIVAPIGWSAMGQGFAGELYFYVFYRMTTDNDGAVTVTAKELGQADASAARAPSVQTGEQP